MTLKTRLVTTISMFCLVVALLITGVWAVSTANVNIGGTISFNATNVYATITGSISGATTTPTLSPLNYSAKSTPSTTELNTWKQNLTFADATIPTIKWTVTIQNKSERALYVTLTDNIATLTNATKTLTFDNGSADGEQTIPAKTSKVYTMEIKVTDTNVSASVDYDFNFDLRDASAQAPVKLQQDANGFYVTMGTYNDSPVVWRLVGLDGSKFTGTTAPTSGTGTFILETTACSAITHAFDADSNDYATSDIRAYLNGDYITDLNLANDATYNAITAREISDLYTDMAWRTDDNYQVEDCTLPSGATGADKLWLMSVAEVYTLIGGETIIDDTISGNAWSENVVRPNIDWSADIYDDYYFLRTPYPGSGSLALFIDEGAPNDDSVSTSLAVRPAFNLEF